MIFTNLLMSVYFFMRSVPEGSNLEALHHGPGVVGLGVVGLGVVFGKESFYRLRGFDDAGRLAFCQEGGPVRR